MATTNHERVGKALDLLKVGLKPYVEREMRAADGQQWLNEAMAGLRDGRLPLDKEGEVNWDTHALLAVAWNAWNRVFAKKLGNSERTLVSELRTVRNDWAHQKPFSTDDAYRALDSVQRLLSAVSAEQAQEVDRMKQELLRVRFDEQARNETRKIAVAPTEGQPASGLKPWREVVTPHPDVASGEFQRAEYAADLAQVYRGEGSDEYGKPRNFYERTFITHGLGQLLAGALKRLNGAGGDPVVELQTNFGGGKTHSMIALYHLFSGASASELVGVDAVLTSAGVTSIPKARRAVLVGQELNPAKPHRKPDGVETHTLWGELAWQLLKKEGYAFVAEADKSGVSPGTQALREVFKRAAPCLILIDEWIAYVRMLYGISEPLPAGSFDANMTFAQTLTEAAKGTPRTLVVASIPASDAEVGGEGGRAALERIRNVFARVESPWTPASTEEGFEIVRRRLFEPIVVKELFAARDAVTKKFGEYYRANAKEFPARSREADYERRIKSAYPVHPELFDRLFDDWSTLEKFQRTRGVLRLMAAVIHTLWQRNDTNLLIMPANVPIDEPSVQFELMKYLDDSWRAVIESDVDGPHSVALRMDGDNPTMGRYSACRRVARTVFIGSAPKLEAANRGVEDIHMKLGCAQPGETAATFGDALRKLTDQTTYLYQDGRRYWYSTQPNVTRLARDRAEQQSDESVLDDLQRRLREQAKTRGDFSANPVVWSKGVEVGEAHETRLVILGPEYNHSSKIENSSARKAAEEVLSNRGSGPRLLKNTVVFLAADRARLEELKKAVRDFLAWRSIDEEHVALNLDPSQAQQAERRREEADSTVNQRMPEAFQWLLVPDEEKPGSGSTPQVHWDEARLQGQDALAVRAAKRLRSDENMITEWAGALLRARLDDVPLWRANHVELKQLADDFARYLYLPRLRDSKVLAEAARDGLAQTTLMQDGFAYADSYDETKGRYSGLHVGKLVSVSMDRGGLLVKPEVATAQRDAETATGATSSGGGADGTTTTTPGTGAGPLRAGTPTGQEPKAPKRFHGSVTLNPIRLGRDTGTIADEVVQHLAKLVGANIEVTLEIDADVPDGVPDNVVRTVTENCRTLKFRTHGFEET